MSEEAMTDSLRVAAQRALNEACGRVGGHIGATCGCYTNTVEGRVPAGTRCNQVVVILEAALSLPEQQVTPSIQPLEQLKIFSHLRRDWDSYGAAPLDSRAIHAAEVLLTAPPTVVPRSGGGVALEWHTQDVDIEVCIEADGTLEESEQRVSGGEPNEWSGKLPSGELITGTGPAITEAMLTIWRVEPTTSCEGQTWRDFAERCDVARMTAEVRATGKDVNAPPVRGTDTSSPLAAALLKVLTPEQRHTLASWLAPNAALDEFVAFLRATPSAARRDA